MSGVVDMVLCGATGRLGNAIVHALSAGGEALGVRVCAAVAPSVASGSPTRALPKAVPAFATLGEALDAAGADAVVVDVTHAEPALSHLHQALERGHHVVLGATGVDDGVLRNLGAGFADAGLGLLYVPNFSLGAVLAMRCAAQLASYFPSVEIVETHHDAKRDSPSGTAYTTAVRIAAARRLAQLPDLAPHAPDSPARGVVVDGVPIHSLRLAGATAHQETVFGGQGELLTIRHDAIDRSCYAPGVARAVRGVPNLRGLEIGLETVL